MMGGWIWIVKKNRKNSFISGAIDLDKGRFKDEEIEILYDLVKNRSKYDGSEEKYTKSIVGWCSDGKYTRHKETTYTFRGDEDGVRIEEHLQYNDDDGQSGSSDRVFSTGRDILNVLNKVFRQ